MDLLDDNSLPVKTVDEFVKHLITLNNSLVDRVNALELRLEKIESKSIIIR